MALRDDEAVKGLMRDLRVLAGCDSLLSALRGRETVKDVLALVITHADSAADNGRQVLRALGNSGPKSRGGER
ncbi:hypothetical protein AB0F46_35455 [Streptomyces sp. NPDC026665]|uniref:hypothetical protein n=1 Tax=Streptomyces sp. NPDC026665 TaxID=3154798 RepID=UPI0033D555C8